VKQLILFAVVNLIIQPSLFDRCQCEATIRWLLPSNINEEIDSSIKFSTYVYHPLEEE
jgi:hypothetical protein